MKKKGGKKKKHTESAKPKEPPPVPVSEEEEEEAEEVPRSNYLQVNYDVNQMGCPDEETFDKLCNSVLSDWDLDTHRYKFPRYCLNEWELTTQSRRMAFNHFVLFESRSYT